MGGMRGLNVGWRALLGFAQACFMRWNRRSLNKRVLLCITSFGGRVAVSNAANQHPLPVILGLNDGQMFDRGARIHIWLPALSDEQWNELRPRLQSLGTLASLEIVGGNVAGPDC